MKTPFKNVTVTSLVSASLSSCKHEMRVIFLKPDLFDSFIIVYKDDRG